MTNPYAIHQISSNELFLFHQLIDVFHEVFEINHRNGASNNHLLTLISDPHFIVFCAIENNVVIGGTTAYVLSSYYTSAAELYIYDVAVNKEHQRKGVGKSLLKALKEWSKENGVTNLFVQANKEDESAIRFYLSAGGRQEDVVHFTFLPK